MNTGTLGRQTRWGDSVPGHVCKVQKVNQETPKYFPVVGEAFPQPLLHCPGLGVGVRVCKILHDRLGLVLSPREDVGWF